MDTKTIRIGIVGAGANTRLRHISGFQQIEGVEVVSVANRTRASSERVAREFKIPMVYESWEELVRADDTDAICIGTWPNMHCPITLAALEAGKHVLCEARMAMNAREAREMLRASKQHPDLVTQVVPAPFTLPFDVTIRKKIDEGFLGDLLSISLQMSDSQFVDRAGSLTWRQDAKLSGLNTLFMGIWYESLMRWVGPAQKVMSMSRVFVDKCLDNGGQSLPVTVPDHVDILAEMEGGALAHLRFSAVTGLNSVNQVWLFGSEATLMLDAASMKLYEGVRGDKQLKETTILKNDKGYWRVEEEFIGAIRGEETIKLTTFEEGVRYMEFTEAVAVSAESGRGVEIPNFKVQMTK